jgi:tight adherence protein B
MELSYLTLFTFLAVALVVIGIYSLVSDLVMRDRSRVSRRVDKELVRQKAKTRKELFKMPTGLPPESVAAEDLTPSFHERFTMMVEQSGLRLTPEGLVGLMAAAALAAGSIALILRMALGIMDLTENALPVALAAVAGGVAPFAYVYRKRNQRKEKLVSQLPDAFDLMARVIRSGQTMAQALLAVADEFEAPIAAEFSYCYEQQNLGLPPDVALRDLARRTGVMEIKIFVLAVLVHQQTGGNLAELLDKLAGVVRERFRVRGKIRALTAEGRLQAFVLLLLPPALFLILLVLHPSYGQVLLGQSLFLCNGDILILMGVFEILGAIWINKIVNFDF